MPPYEIEERIRAEERRMREEAVRLAEEEIAQLKPEKE
ncbi:MAG: hypothetical protein BECKG1743D_GA0114223_111701 [Candidatus Kentron sp. G]|nr:MAG: hypothetical protein BECKG1743F_GA0114225_111202 [Candidatus Kentron sp. G]VFN07582.1 MAG: hypothetical protein BECKG1743E_GA0114224_112451 [Candidatus Kentron sp. G]VFN07866.1 MAG: hypothetical protein BECKG1743D_GA0114223_111701 [Candidatus Kentron sp. G]